MSINDPRGTVQRVYSNGNGDVVAVIKWVRGTGPALVIGEHFRDGQSVKMRGAEVVPA
jgi:hypothetical protein